MVFVHHSREVKELVLWHRNEGHLDDDDICFIFHVSVPSLYRWQHNVDDFGDVIRPRNPLQGRPPLLSAQQLGTVLRAIDDDPSLFLDEIRDWVIISHDVDLSKSTVQRIIADCAYSYKLLRRTAAERDPVAREAHHKYIRDNILDSMVIAVDETSKDDRTIFRRYGRAPRGMRAQIEANFVRGERYSLVGGLATDGFVATRVVEGSVNGAEFFDFIVEDILPHMNPFPGDKSVLLLDNCAIHKSEYLRQMVESRGCVLIFLPPYSPDYNPIEEAFSAIKHWIRRNYHRLMNSVTPMADLQEAADCVTAEMAKAYFRSAHFPCA